MGWKMVYNSLDKNRENREKMLLTFAKNSIRSKPPPSFRAVYHNKNHVITNTEDRVCQNSQDDQKRKTIPRTISKLRQRQTDVSRYVNSVIRLFSSSLLP